MKFLLLALFCFQANAYDLDLNQEKINVGELTSRGGLASQVLEVRRSISTPDHVYLNVVFNQEYKFCSKTATRRVWVPGEYWPDCTERRCYPGRTPGHYETETYCTEYATASKKVSEEIKLDFDDASTLVASEEEVFVLSLNQKAKDSQDFNLKGEVKRAVRSYEITQKKNKNKLQFAVQD